ncbi:Transcriptional regulator [Cytospora mali]|uniref:Transcriptional regulator n=1 Tax=Cytospora mali TaxID=578113 RepID=A0A194V3U0_CYTMA|nr:Transcriptional regulator [Valsa mali var. pyri (nom. inval.)]
MVFCAYCGKSFTRKEHLERHIPSHTNVKPHRCSACQLSFARRDLLQRHHSTYHEARDPMDPLPGGVPTVAGRTPIACQNCANAKTGCDKRVPCSRCAEKNLPCAARFARRSSKAAVRAAQASAALNNQMLPGTQRPQVTAISPSMMDIDQTLAGSNSPGKGSPPKEMTAVADTKLHLNTQQKSTSEHNHFSPDGFSSPHNKLDVMNDFMQLGNEFVSPDSNYSDLLVWPEYPIELDMYSSAMAIRPELGHGLPSFADLSDVSSNSEPMTTASSCRGSIHTRTTSIMSSVDFEPLKPVDMTMCAPNDTKVAEFEVVIAAEDSWPLARCNPPTFSGSCPRTAIVHLEALEQKCKQDGTWDSLEKYLGHHNNETPHMPSVVPINSRTRDKMTAITQSFVHKALGVHRGGVNAYTKSGYSSPGGMCNFIMLPPSNVLEYFLKSYVRSLFGYYPMIAAMSLDPNEMLQDTQASTLLVLLMIARGAAAVPMAEARYLSAGLTETCRISLFDIIEKDVELSADPIALRCALLFTLLGAWSGDKWQMDIAMGQRGMYLAMLKHAGMLEPQPSMIPTFNDSTSAELQWRAWMHRETQNRLVYNWVMVDQELSLFHDTAPVLSISELQCPLPGPELLWLSSNSEQWLAGVQSIYGCTNNVNPQLLSTPSLTPSLFDLFQDFLHDNLPRRQRTTARTVTKSSTLQRLEEVQALLQKWYELALAYHKANPACTMTKCNIVLYHLISLNAVTNFPEIERLARKEGFEAGGPTYWELSLRHKRCVYQREEAVFHCGQVLRLLRSIPADKLPPWWGAAMYRATLILWTDAVGRLDPSFKIGGKEGGSSPENGGAVTPEDPALISYLWSGDGVAVLTRADGAVVSMDNPSDILDLGIKALEGGASTRVGDGIKRKLVTLSGNWSSDAIGIGS